MTPLLPEGWPRPSGYSNGTAAEGRMVFVAGQVGWDTAGNFPDSFIDQFEQTLRNTVAVLKAGGAGPEHVTRMTWYVTDLDEYRAAVPHLGHAYRTHMGKVFPAMAVVGVSGLVEPKAKLEIESTAVSPID